MLLYSKNRSIFAPAKRHTGYEVWQKRVKKVHRHIGKTAYRDSDIFITLRELNYFLRVGDAFWL